MDLMIGFLHIGLLNIFHLHYGLMFSGTDFYDG